MSKISNELKFWVLEHHDVLGDYDGPPNELFGIADRIDAEHERRMEQAKREVRRTMARDMRWATTMLEARESRRHIREGLEGGPND